MSVLPQPALSIMIVDDDDVDIRTLSRALKDVDIVDNIVVAHDGVEALDMLRSQDIGGLAWPWIILLDINMPRMTGLEFLSEIRKDPGLHETVIFMLSTSDDNHDMTEAYSNHIAGYIVKTVASGNYDNLISMIRNYTETVRFHSRRVLSHIT
ncbi:MAG: response regulator [Gammaproteobacteria bacterium]|nr:response regulator [Gammaproteobacteria bacterium]